MRLFKKDKGQNILLKLYRTVNSKVAGQFDTTRLIDILLQKFIQLNLEPNDFYVTGPYPDNGWKSVTGFLNGLKKKGFKNVHHILISDQEDKMQFSFQNWAHNYTTEIEHGKLTFEISLDSKIATEETLYDLADDLADLLKFDYGYIFFQSKNLSLDESKKVNGLFSYTEKQNPDFNKWNRYESSANRGHLRKIYQVNFITDSHVKRLKENNVDIGKFKNFNHAILWTLTESEIADVNKILEESDLLVGNISFDKTEIKRRIDEELNALQHSV